MATNLETKIGRIRNNVTAALAKIAEKGVTVPEGAGSDDLEGLIDAITGGGSLPDGVSAIACGSFTPTEDISTSYTVDHGLGVEPDFVYIYADNRDATLDTDWSGYLIEFVISRRFVLNNNTTWPVVEIAFFRNSSGTCRGSFGTGKTPPNASTFTISETWTAYMGKLKAGATYQWVAGVIGGLS